MKNITKVACNAAAQVFIMNALPVPRYHRFIFFASRWGRMAKIELVNFLLFHVLSHVPSGKLIFDLAPPSGTPKSCHFWKMKIIKKRLEL